MSNEGSRITFGIIVLNGEPFTRYCLRSIYPFAHQIIVVEGGSRHAAAFCTPDGHSTDGTLEVLRQFKEQEDPEGKLEVVTREGFWEEKDEQSRAYAERATGNWLWQVDIDEFYKPEDMRKVLALLQNPPLPTAVSFPTITFWGGPEYEVDGVVLRSGGQCFRRLFSWGSGYSYSSHRPPTVLDAENRGMSDLRPVSGRRMAALGVYLYHYALLFPHQAIQKAVYYQSLSDGRRRGETWLANSYRVLKEPFRIHNSSQHRSWLQRCAEAHPPEVARMMADIRSGELHVELRDNRDVEQLLSRTSYCVRRSLLRSVAPVYGAVRRLWSARHRRTRSQEVVR